MREATECRSRPLSWRTVYARAGRPAPAAIPSRCTWRETQPLRGSPDTTAPSPSRPVPVLWPHRPSPDPEKAPSALVAGLSPSPGAGYPPDPGSHAAPPPAPLLHQRSDCHSAFPGRPCLPPSGDSGCHTGRHRPARGHPAFQGVFPALCTGRGQPGKAGARRCAHHPHSQKANLSTCRKSPNEPKTVRAKKQSSAAKTGISI